MSNRRELTSKELLIAATAKRLWLAKKQSEKVTQADANGALGWTTSVFGQYINGNMPMSADAVTKLAKYLSVSPYEIDPSLADKFPVPPEELADIEGSLSLMSEREIISLMKRLSERLSPRESKTLIEILLDRMSR